MNKILLSWHKWLQVAGICLVFSCEQPQLCSDVKIGTTVPIPLSCGVEHFSGSNGRSSTWISFSVGTEFTRSLPEGIEEVSVTVNGETLPLSKSNFTYFSDRRLFWASLLGAPKLGDYEIAVKSQSRTGTAADRLTSIFSIDPPKPDNASPDSTNPCHTNRPLFGWSAAKADSPIY